MTPCGRPLLRLHEWTYVWPSRRPKGKWLTAVSMFSKAVFWSRSSATSSRTMPKKSILWSWSGHPTSTHLGAHGHEHVSALHRVLEKLSGLRELGLHSFGSGKGYMNFLGERNRAPEELRNTEAGCPLRHPSQRHRIPAEFDRIFGFRRIARFAAFGSGARHLPLEG